MPTPATVTSAENKTNFVLAFSYTYTGYSFYWDGDGEAFWHETGSLLLSRWEPAGRRLQVCRLGADVTAQVATAVNRDDQVIVAIVAASDLG
ncbi:hypothetical protein K438DRAFT_1845657 [Mycena galopus ATCC 62051]|nr:hypothetical protein K438DRAFT_1845657 [Mycena galopus ATCC 62051]